MIEHVKVLAALVIGSASFLGSVQRSSATTSAVTAIDILLNPDETVIKAAEAVNARMLRDFPKGFSLDATHRPHITLLQRYVRTADLDNIYTVVDRIFRKEAVTGFKLKATKHYYIPSGEIGLSGIVIETTADLLRLQQELIDAVAAFTVKSGTSAAFITAPGDPEINQGTMHYIEVFVPEHSGTKFLPHVSTGIATRAYLDKMMAEPFESFTFSPIGAAIYHLGDFGTARTELRAFDVK
ncbi:MAG TPA: hypothetical protein DDZ81_24620 [Acetobacteraceae bacterium]|jgi:hypothetical protein|nr:hypothetical protein [Acetobacteraceae bacterium]